MSVMGDAAVLLNVGQGMFRDANDNVLRVLALTIFWQLALAQKFSGRRRPTVTGASAMAASFKRNCRCALFSQASGAGLASFSVTGISF